MIAQIPCLYYITVTWSLDERFVVESLKSFGWNNVGLASQTVAQHYFTIVPMYRVIWVVVFRGIKRHRMAVRANMGQSPNSVSMLGQRQIQLTSFKPAMGCDASPTLNQYWMGRLTYMYIVCTKYIVQMRTLTYQRWWWKE